MVRLADLRTTTVGRPIVVLPLGSCEQHGPHLPIGTDTTIAESIIAATEPSAFPTVIAPSISITASGEHAGFAGTLSIGTDATTNALVELIRSADWAAGIIIVNGHGGNIAALNRAIETSHRDGRTATAAWSPSTRAPNDLHAGWVETSVMLHLRPDLVDMALAAAGPQPDLAALRANGVAALSPSGVLGDPTTATAALGRQIFDGWVADLTAFIDGRINAWQSNPEHTR